MKLELHRIEAPFVFQLSNETGAKAFLDASPEIGGLNKGLRPMEMLAGSLAACAAIDVISMLQKQRENLEHFSVRIEAQRSNIVPAAFESIALIFAVDSTIDAHRLERNIQLALEKYCSVAASLNTNIEINFTIEKHETSRN